MLFNSANKVMKLCIEEVVVSFEGKGVDGCDAGVYPCEGDEGRGSPSCVDEDARHYAETNEKMALRERKKIQETQPRVNK